MGPRHRDQPITETLEQNYMPYAMSVIVSRAIPEIDGFKPSHRKLLYTMFRMGLLTGGRTKSANVVGQTMKLNPHGEAAIYDTLVRLTRGNGSLLHPYIDSKGNFGRQYSRDMQAAASRYTEVRLDRLCEEIFRGIDKDAVDFMDNYDGTLEEPRLLPASFPTILANANQGIAVGMASNICSFNLGEVCRAAIAYIHDPGFEISSIIPGPDLSSGGQLLLIPEEMEKILSTGRGSFRLRAKYQVDRKAGRIEILEIPYSSSVEGIVDDVAELVRSGKIKEIQDIRDETDLNGLRLSIEYRKSADPDALMHKLFRLTGLEAAFGCNFNVLVNGSPRVLGVKALLAEWLSFRRTCIRRETAFDLQKLEEKLHLLRGLETILLDIDAAIRIIRQTAREEDVVPNLMAGFSIDEPQAEYVAEIRLRHLNREYILARTAEIRGLLRDIEGLHRILDDPAALDAIIIRELESVAKKYGAPRRTELVAIEDAPAAPQDLFIEDYNLRIFRTAHGYLKKLPMTSLRTSPDLKTKDDDAIVQEMDGRNRSDILFFTSECNVYKMKLHEIRDTRPSDLGEFMPNLLSMEEGERVLYVHLTDEYAGDILIAFESGRVARIAVKAYETKTNRRKLVKAFSDHAPAVGFHFLPEGASEDCFLQGSSRKGLVVSSDLVPRKNSRDTRGVLVMQPKKNSRLLAFLPVSRAGLEEVSRYRIRSIPAAGCQVREQTVQHRQLGLEEI